jgi:hypothetical protein
MTKAKDHRDYHFNFRTEHQYTLHELRGSHHRTASVPAYFQSSTTPLPPRAVASIWVVSYFGLLREEVLCIDSTAVEDYWMQERGLRRLLATRLQNGDRIGIDNVRNRENVEKRKETHNGKGTMQITQFMGFDETMHFSEGIELCR